MRQSVFSNNFLIKTDLVEAKFTKNKTEIEVRVRCKDGTWIRSTNYPNNPIGTVAVWDLGKTMYSGAISFEGVDNNLKTIDDKQSNAEHKKVLNSKNKQQEI